MDFKGEKHSNDTHASTTDPHARLIKSSGDKSRLCYLGHVLMENRNGLVVDVETTQASGTAEREATIRMIQRSVPAGSTLGADKAYDTAEFVQAMRKAKLTPHVAAKKSGSAIDGRMSLGLGSVGRRVAQEPVDWLGAGGGPTVLTFACWSFTRMATPFGWRSSTV